MRDALTLEQRRPPAQRMFPRSRCYLICFGSPLSGKRQIRPTLLVDKAGCARDYPSRALSDRAIRKPRFDASDEIVCSRRTPLRHH